MLISACCAHFIMTEAYRWLLNQLYLHKCEFPILETGICRGPKLLEWYYTAETGVVTKNSTLIINKTKFLLNHFLNQQTSAQEDYSPHKYVCYVYLQKGMKIITAREAEKLAVHSLNALEVRSLHLAVKTAHQREFIYRINAWNEKNELLSEIEYGQIGKDN